MAHRIVFMYLKNPQPNDRRYLQQPGDTARQKIKCTLHVQNNGLFNLAQRMLGYVFKYLPLTVTICQMDLLHLNAC